LHHQPGRLLGGGVAARSTPGNRQAHAFDGGHLLAQLVVQLA
jgi:hypothetical protein